MVLMDTKYGRRRSRSRVNLTSVSTVREDTTRSGVRWAATSLMLAMSYNTVLFDSKVRGMKMSFFGFGLNPTGFDQVPKGYRRFDPSFSRNQGWDIHLAVATQQLTASTIQQIEIALGARPARTGIRVSGCVIASSF